jgi:predicted adenine nucleotide alpha hydrolase (AANH) superfamily ATPase
MLSRADEYRRRAADAKRHSGQLRDRFMKNAYEQMARDWLTLAEQMEWIDAIKRPARRKPEE